jgi:hypothetical protein
MVLTDLLNGKTGICLLKSKPGVCFKEASQCSRSNELYAIAQQQCQPNTSIGQGFDSPSRLAAG